MGFGWQEMLIVLVVIMVIFGAGRLPDVARSLGQGVKEFKQEAGSPEGILGTGPKVATTAGRVPSGEGQVRATDI
jgi:sec-independent protein translocase protein TatA